MNENFEFSFLTATLSWKVLWNQLEKWSCPNYKCKFSRHVRQTWTEFKVWLR